MSTKTAQESTISTKLLSRWEQTGQKLASLAEAIPDASYEFRPAAGLRTVGDVLRHVAFWNQYVAGTLRGGHPDDAANELPKGEYSTKARIVDALRASTADAAAAIADRNSGLDPQSAETVVSFIEHTSEHYGQLVVYARLEGIVPPSSRG
jgi:uncharacterized damage-inducible protein DinB